MIGTIGFGFYILLRMKVHSLISSADDPIANMIISHVN